MEIRQITDGAQTETVRKNAANTRGRPFQLGNPSRPKGVRNRATQAVEALLLGEAEALTRRAVELALAGDTTALRLCLDRIAPPQKDRPVVFALPKLESSVNAVLASAAHTPMAAFTFSARNGMS